jgi:hypothetical protein
MNRYQRQNNFLLAHADLLLDRFLGCAVGSSSGIARGYSTTTLG